MKKFIAIITVLVMALAIFVPSSMAKEKFSVEFSEGQVVFTGELVDIIAYLSGLDRQELIDLSEIDHGHGTGKYYARVTEQDEILTWSDGKSISVYDLSEDMDEYTFLQNRYILLGDEKNEAVQDFKMVEDQIGSLNDRIYPEKVYDSEERALRAEYTLAEAYPDIDCEDTLSVEEGFEKQKMFRAEVLTRWYSEQLQKTVVSLRWNTVAEEVQEVVTPSKAPKPTKPTKPEKTQGPAPTASPEPTVSPEDDPTHSPARPTATPTVSPEDDPTHSPARPTATPTVSPEEDEFGTPAPTEEATPAPTDEVTPAPTAEVTTAPTEVPPSHEDPQPTAQPSDDDPGTLERDPEDCGSADDGASHGEARPSGDDPGILERDPEDQPSHS